jgi:hypothetical protein
MKTTHFIDKTKAKVIRSNNGDFLPIIAKGDTIMLGLETRTENTIEHYIVDSIEHQLLQKGAGSIHRTDVVTMIYVSPILKP